MHVPEGGGRKFGKYPEGVTASVSCDRDTINSWYLTFDPCWMSTINWRPTWGQVSESSRPHREDPSSEHIQKTNRSSTIPIPEESCKSLTHTPRLGEYQPKRVPNRLDQTNSSAVNLDESSSMTSVKGMDPVEASSSALHLPPYVGINRVVESDKVSNSSSWKYLTEFILDMIRYP